MWGTLSLRWFIPFLQRMLESHTNMTDIRVGEGEGGFVRMLKTYGYSALIMIFHTHAALRF